MAVAGRYWGLGHAGPTRATKSCLEQRETLGSDRVSPRTLEWTHHPSPSCPTPPIVQGITTDTDTLVNFSSIKKRMKSDFKLLQSFSSDKNLHKQHLTPFSQQPCEVGVGNPLYKRTDRVSRRPSDLPEGTLRQKQCWTPAPSDSTSDAPTQATAAGGR